jgi:transcriptional regulator with XRE-family HTH domain
MRVFKARLTRLLLERNMNQTDLANRSGVSRDKISTYMREPPRSLPTNMNVIKIAQALGVSTGDLLPTLGDLQAHKQPLEVIGSASEGFRVRINIPLPFEAFSELTALIQRVTAGAYGPATSRPEQ